MAPRRLLEAQNDPKKLQKGPKRPQNGSKRPQHGSKMAPRCLQNGVKMVPKAFQNGTKCRESVEPQNSQNLYAVEAKRSFSRSIVRMLTRKSSSRSILGRRKGVLLEFWATQTSFRSVTSSKTPPQTFRATPPVSYRFLPPPPPPENPLEPETPQKLFRDSSETLHVLLLQRLFRNSSSSSTRQSGGF